MLEKINLQEKLPVPWRKDLQIQVCVVISSCKLKHIRSSEITPTCEKNSEIITFSFVPVGKEKEEINQQGIIPTKIDISLCTKETSKSPGQ